MADHALPFEKPILELETKLEELKSFSQTQDIDLQSEIQTMENKIRETRRNVYSNLTAWQKVQMARHPQRPYTQDYFQSVFTDFQELHGDRLFRDDRALIGGFAKLDGRSVMVLGTQKGRDTRSNLTCNFGCPYPEGYRKALRLMKLADKFRLPLISFIDTPGAYPGLESEERHVAEAIAVNLREAFSLRIPYLSVVIGEGGSGGALGIGVSNRILVLEHAYYSVISPEGCAAILWKDRAFADRAADNLKLTAQSLLNMGIADEVIPEPFGGAHRDPAVTAERVKDAITRHLADLDGLSPEQLKENRYVKYRSIGAFETVNA